MNIVTVLVALAMAAIGATLYFLDSIGLGIALIVCAAVVSQTATLANIWRRQNDRRYDEGRSPASRDAAMDHDILKSAVSEIEEASVDTRSFLKHIHAAWHKPDAQAPPHRSDKGM